MTFGEKLRQLRKEAGLSENQLAKRSGVSFGAIHNYGLGLRLPSFAAVVKIASALGTTCEVFAACEDVAADEAEGRTRKRKRRR
jgi:transcriptional regulator with XRE-family HTH domain